MKLSGLPLQASSADVAAFFSGLKLDSLYMCVCSASKETCGSCNIANTQELECIVYVLLDTAAGTELAAQRSGELLYIEAMGTKLRSIVTYAEPWEVYCAKSHGFRVSGRMTAQSLAQQLRRQCAPLQPPLCMLQPPELISAFWILHFNNFTPVAREYTSSRMEELLHKGYEHVLVEQLVQQHWRRTSQHGAEAEDGQGDALEKDGLGSPDTVIAALRTRLVYLWQVAAMRDASTPVGAEDAGDASNEKEALADVCNSAIARLAKFYEIVYCLLERMRMQTAEIAIAL